MKFIRTVSKETIHDMFRADTEISSTRVMAYLVWVFTKWWMMIFGTAFLVVYVLDTFEVLEIDDTTMGVMIKFFSWSVIILLTTAFTPKALGKFAETGIFKSKKKGDDNAM